MDGTGLLMMRSIVIVGIICAIALFSAIIMKKYGRIFISLGVFILYTTGILAVDKINFYRFENMPSVQVDENEIKILNSGTTSLGSFSRYIIAEEDKSGNMIIQNDGSKNDCILSETDKYSYNYHMDTKFGYTFTAENKGKAYICVAEVSGACLEYFDIYEVVVDDNMNIQLQNTEHIVYNVDFEKNISKKYSFILEYMDYFK